MPSAPHLCAGFFWVRKQRDSEPGVDEWPGKECKSTLAAGSGRPDAACTIIQPMQQWHPDHAPNCESAGVPGGRGDVCLDAGSACPVLLHKTPPCYGRGFQSMTAWSSDSKSTRGGIPSQSQAGGAGGGKPHKADSQCERVSVPFIERPASSLEVELQRNSADSLQG